MTSGAVDRLVDTNAASAENVTWHPPRLSACRLSCADEIFGKRSYYVRISSSMNLTEDGVFGELVYAADGEVAQPALEVGPHALGGVEFRSVGGQPEGRQPGPGDNFKTQLIEKAIEMAARNHRLADQAIFHSDRGSNYTSRQFAKTLRNYRLRQSVGRTGICYDNAMAESFFAALKNERVHRTQYPTREHARRDIARYIEFWYNTKLRHSGLHYRTPKQAHDDYLKRQLAA